jgi:hypothetical protein
MKNLTRDINLFVLRNAKSNNVRIVFFIISLGMFILSAGAPDATGGLK